MSALDFFRDIGIEIPERGGTNRSVACFANPEGHSHGDRRPSLSINVETGAWHCFACESKGGPYDAALIRGQSGAEAMDLLRRHGLARENATALPTNRAEPPRLPSEEDVARWHRALMDRPSFLERLGELKGWTSEALRDLSIGLDGDYLTIPIRDDRGELVAFNRYLPNPALRNGRAKMWGSKGAPRTLFPAPESIESATTLYLVEGEPDAIAVASLGLPAVGVPGVQGWRESDAERFRGRDVAVLFDCDQQGRSAAHRVAEALDGITRRVRVLDLDPARDDGWDVGDFAADARSDQERHNARELLFAATDDAPVFEASRLASAPTGEASQGEARGRLISRAVSDYAREPMPWLWPGWIPLTGYTHLAGDPGLGKSTATCWIASNVTRGVWGSSGVVLLATAEDSISSVVRPRLEAAGADLSRVEVLGFEQHGFESGITLPEHAEALRDRAREVGASLIIIDPINAHLSSEIDSYKDHSVRRALAPLHTIAEELSCAILGVAHLTKSRDADPLRRVSGSVGFVGAARSGLLFSRDPDDSDGESGSSRLLAQHKSNHGRLSTTLRFEIESVQIDEDIAASRLADRGESKLGASQLLEGPVQGEERSALDEACDFLEAELEGGPVASNEVTLRAKQNGISEKTLRRARRQLDVEKEREGFGSEGRWMMSLPIDGQPSRGRLSPEPWPSMGKPLNQAESEGAPRTNESIDGQHVHVADNGTGRRLRENSDEDHLVLDYTGRQR